MEKTESTNDLAIKIKSDALRLLSFRPRSIEELKARLRDKKYTSPLIDETVLALTKQGLLDDTKFAKLYAETKVHSRPTGKKSLMQDLKRKGLSDALIQKTVSEIKDYDEVKMAKDLITRRFSKMTGVSPQKRKARIFGFLKRRGFTGNVIAPVMNDFFKNFNATDLEASHDDNE